MDFYATSLAKTVVNYITIFVTTQVPKIKSNLYGRNESVKSTSSGFRDERGTERADRLADTSELVSGGAFASRCGESRRDEIVL